MTDQNIIRLSIAEAGKIFGVDQKTIRRAIHNNLLRYVIIRGRYRITFESLLKWSQERPKIHNKFVKQGIGQYIEKWRIRNKLFSPNPELAKKEKAH